MRYFKKIMNETVKYDLEAITKKKYSFPYLCYCIIKNRGFRYVFYLRMAGKKGIFKPLFMLLHSKLSHKMNNEISYKTKIGKGFTLGHPSSIVINPDAELAWFLQPDFIRWSLYFHCFCFLFCLQRYIILRIRQNNSWLFSSYI